MSDLLAMRYADGATDMDAVRALFREYEAALGVSPCFEGFEAELAGLPGGYAGAGGCIFLAEADGRPAGVVALRAVDEATGEMRRLYVRPSTRGLGLGRRLAACVVDEARKRGCRRLRLHTLSRLTEAVALYRSMGFVETAPVDGVAHGGVLRLELAL